MSSGERVAWRMEENVRVRDRGWEMEEEGTERGREGVRERERDRERQREREGGGKGGGVMQTAGDNLVQ